MGDKGLTIFRNTLGLILGLFSLNALAGDSYQEIKLATVDLQYIDFRLLSSETPFGINMYTLNAANLSISPFEKNQVNMSVQVAKLPNYSATLLFRLQDASSGGCYLNIHGDPVMTTIEAIGKFSKCYVKAAYHRNDNSLKLDMGME